MPPMVIGNYAMDLNKLVFLVYHTSNEPSQKELESIVLTAKEHNTNISFSNKMLAQNLPKSFKAKLAQATLLA